MTAKKYQYTRNNGLPATWTPETVELIKTLAVQNVSISEIARQIDGGRRSTRRLVSEYAKYHHITIKNNNLRDARKCSNCRNIFYPEGRFFFLCNDCKRTDDWKTTTPTMIYAR